MIAILIVFNFLLTIVANFISFVLICYYSLCYHKEQEVNAMSTFGENLRALRKSRGYSQEKFANEIGSNQMTVSSWEVGTRMPSLETVKHVAEVFHVPVSSLISLETLGNEDDSDRELLDVIKSNPKIRTIVDKSRYLSNADLNMIIDMVSALTRTRV